MPAIPLPKFACSETENIRHVCPTKTCLMNAILSYRWSGRKRLGIHKDHLPKDMTKVTDLACQHHACDLDL